MRYSALVPVKALPAAKSRLARYLTSDERETLVFDMLHHVLSILQNSAFLDRVAVVSPDKQVLEQVRAWGAQPLLERKHGHNPALHAAAMQARAEGTTALLTISADLPLLSSGDINALIEQSWQHQVVLAPSRDGTGTNAILVRPPLAVPYLFGPGSLQSYVYAAKQRHLNSTIYHSFGLGLDIDTIEDLHELQFVSCEAR